MRTGKTAGSLDIEEIGAARCDPATTVATSNKEDGLAILLASDDIFEVY